MDNLYQMFLGLGGTAVLISFLVGAFKRFGWIKDGDSQKWHTSFQLIAFLAIGIFDVLGFNVDLAVVDSVAGTIAEVGAAVLGLLGMFGVGRLTYTVTKGAPVVGFTYSE